MRATALSDLPAWAARMLADERVARLGLLDEDGRPRVQPVTFSVWDGRLWTAVDAKPKRVAGERLARVRRLRRDRRATLTVDRYAEDWEQLAWVQVLGDVDVVEVGSAAEALDALLAKYPQYRAAQPAGPLLALTPTRCLCWRASPST